MKVTSGLRCRALCVGAVAFMLSGCGGTQPLGGAPGAMSQGLVNEVHTGHAQPWMLPEAKTIKQLLYVSVGSANEVYVYNYKTGEQVGLLTGFAQPEGQCVDSIGNVWVTNFGDPPTSGYAVEYAHGGTTPLSRRSVGGPSIGCSVDPTSGDLAVSTAWGGNGAELFIFKNAGGGVPRVLRNDWCDVMNSPGYDDKGNLFVEGAGCVGGSCGDFVCWVQHGVRPLDNVTTNVTIHSGGSMMWDGKHMTLTDTFDEINHSQIRRQAVIYQMREDASGNLTKVGQTVLRCDKQCYRLDGDYPRKVAPSTAPPTLYQPFIVGTKNTPINRHRGNAVVFSNDLIPENFHYWSYPVGRQPLKTLDLQSSTGESVSIAP